MLLSRILLQAFTLTFLAEWGDRSQLTTIILAAREVTVNNFIITIATSLCAWNFNCININYLQDVYGVVLGGILGHSFCTGLAVLGGRIIAQRISVRTGNIQEKIIFRCV